jgi:hypothetical protein
MEMDLAITHHQQIIQTHSLMMELSGRTQTVMVMEIIKVDLMLTDLLMNLYSGLILIMMVMVIIHHQ